MLGSVTPRLWTTPLATGPIGDCPCGQCALTEDTSYGFDVIVFARDFLGEPLDTWQELAVIHGGELLPDGRPRFRYVLLMVARQNGKTHLLKVLIKFWLFIERWPLILASSTDRSKAKETWDEVCEEVAEHPSLRPLLPVPKQRGSLPGKVMSPGDEHLVTLHKSRYRFGAISRRLARGKSVDRLVLDELREHANWEAWNASTKAMNARPGGQAWLVSNAGDDKSIVLHSRHKEAREAVDDPTTRIGLLEWSAAPEDDPMDPQTWAKANPSLGGPRYDISVMETDAKAALTGPKEMAGFKTENLCIYVPQMNPAFDLAAWGKSAVPGDVYGLEQVWCFDIALNGRHATLVAAAKLPDGRVRVQPLAKWSGLDGVERARLELPGKVAKHRPKRFGWFPTGRAREFAADLRDRSQKGRRYAWPPPGVDVAEIAGEAKDACMGFSQRVGALQIVHGDDEYLNEHIENASKKETGGTFVYECESGDIDGAYAAAGAWYLASTLPQSLGKPRILVARNG